MSVTLTPYALWTALHDVLPLAGSADDNPVLASVRLEADGGNLLAIASDRFAFGVSRVDCGGDKLAATLPATVAKVAMKAARRASNAENGALAKIALLEDDLVRIECGSGESIACKQRDEYIRWRAFIPANPTIGGELRVDPKRLAQFAHVRQHALRDAMTLLPTRRKGNSDEPGMVIVRIGADFVGGVMPVRGEGEGYTRPGWLP